MSVGLPALCPQGHVTVETVDHEGDDLLVLDAERTCHCGETAAIPTGRYSRSADNPAVTLLCPSATRAWRRMTQRSTSLRDWDVSFDHRPAAG
jgi:hypothetical protein